MSNRQIKDVTAIGCELEILVSDIELGKIKSKDEFFEAVKEVVLAYDQGRECFPVDLEIEDADEIRTKAHPKGPFVETPPSGFLRVFQSAVAKRNYYYFKCDIGEELVFETKKFLGYNVVEKITQGNQLIEFDEMEAGRPNEEPFGYLMVGKNGELIQSYTNQYFCISEDDWDDYSGERLRQTTDEWYAEIFG